MEFQPKAYAMYATDNKLRRSSSSGGVFSLLARQILARQGLVYGVAMTQDCREAVFCRVEHRQELEKLRGSKYLQAQMGRTYFRIREDLEGGRPVLFSGTGCQVAGLKAFLGKEYPNLVCLDVICHGVPSAALWQRYVDWRQSQVGSPMTQVYFRCKKLGWDGFGLLHRYRNGASTYCYKDEDPYLQMFLKNQCLRPSCYACTAKTRKCSDITLADFWGIEKLLPEMDDEQGTSLVLVRTEKGQHLCQGLSGQVVQQEVDYQTAIQGNLAEFLSAGCPEERAHFYEDMQQLDFPQLIRKYVPGEPVSAATRCKRLMKQGAMYPPLNGLYRTLRRWKSRR